MPASEGRHLPNLLAPESASLRFQGAIVIADCMAVPPVIALFCGGVGGGIVSAKPPQEGRGLWISKSLFPQANAGLAVEQPEQRAHNPPHKKLFL